MDIGQIIKAKRKQAGLTQVELSERAGLVQAQLSKIEAGQCSNVTINTLRGIAKALGCSVTDLLPEQDKKTKADKVDRKSAA